MSRKRVVLEHTCGPRKGITQILGQADLLTLGDRPLPEFMAHVDAGALGGVEFASLIKVTPSMVLYREAFREPTGRFGQQMDSFHPEQR